MPPIVRSAAIWLLALVLVAWAAFAILAVVGLIISHGRLSEPLVTCVLLATIAVPPVAFTAGRLAVTFRNRPFERIKLGKTLLRACAGFGALGGVAMVADHVLYPGASDAQHKLNWANHLGSFFGGALGTAFLAAITVGCAGLLWNMLAAHPERLEHRLKIAETFD